MGWLTARRPEIGSRTASVLVALWIMALCNRTFWAMAYEAFGGFTAGFLTFGLSVSLLLTALIISFSVKYAFKPFAVFLILVSAVASYFTDTFGTIINEQMIDSAMTTNAREAGALISGRYLTHVALYGVLPVLLLFWVRVRHETLGRKTIGNLKLLVPMLALTGVMVWLNLGTYIVTIRANDRMTQTLNPAAPLSAAWNYGVSSFTTANVVAAPIGQDAKKGPVIAAAPRPVVTVIVAGETARAMNFSLNGYERKTNPQLEKLDIVNFPNVTSCGTDTATSLPCMFSQFRREDYSNAKGKAFEGLLDVFRYAGIPSVWYDNNTGSKGVADRVFYVPLMDSKDPALCPDNECRDEIFLQPLREELQKTKESKVIVLHQIGSHGPAYFRRYGADLATFKPDCRSTDLPKCSLEEVRNAYDNSILATDDFLAKVIKLLAEQDSAVSSALLYVSDHGESLGENGIYLHGAPYNFAPEQQTHVPMISWFSPSYSALTGLDRACLAKLPANAYSHDNLFHTALGMMNVETSVYDAGLDIFRSCRLKGNS